MRLMWDFNFSGGIDTYRLHLRKRALPPLLRISSRRNYSNHLLNFAQSRTNGGYFTNTENLITL